MCSIIGIYNLKTNNLKEELLKTLKFLEYRGYDSSGIAYSEKNAVQIQKVFGDVDRLRQKIENIDISSSTGIGHTRWATHGEPSERNAHPHGNEKVAIVHNGIIENFLSLKTQLLEMGYHFVSETDTEVALNLIDAKLKKGMKPLDIMASLYDELKGAFAIVAIFNTGDLYAIRKKSPLVFGTGNGIRIASDPLAIAQDVNNKISFLGDEHIFECKNGNYTVFTRDLKKVEPEFLTINNTETKNDLGGYKHFMIKEIHEQEKIFQNYKISETPLNIERPQRILIIAAGSSYLAGMIAKYWLERIAEISCDVEIASEFFSRKPVLSSTDLCILISQSGETADVLSAFEVIKEAKIKTLGILNVKNSILGNLVDQVLTINAGPEIGVASTKAFTAQLAVLYNLAQHFAGNKLENYKTAANDISTILSEEKYFAQLAIKVLDYKNIIYLGRDVFYTLALEGALKMKEISYINAQGYPSGEMKHGPIALIDNEVLVISFLISGDLLIKSLSNTQAVLSRGANVIVIADAEALPTVKNELSFYLEKCVFLSLPKNNNPDLYVFSATVILQLLSYYVAYAKGCSIDKPKNLAKSVTVE